MTRPASFALRPPSSTSGSLRPSVPVLRPLVPVVRPAVPLASRANRPTGLAAAKPDAQSPQLPPVGAAPRALRTPILMKEGQR